MPTEFSIKIDGTDHDYLNTTTPVVDNTTDIIDDHHNNQSDAILALETKVGADSSAISTSHDYKFAAFYCNSVTDSGGTTTSTTFTNIDATNFKLVMVLPKDCDVLLFMTVSVTSAISGGGDGGQGVYLEIWNDTDSETVGSNEHKIAVVGEHTFLDAASGNGVVMGVLTSKTAGTYNIYGRWKVDTGITATFQSGTIVCFAYP